MVGRVAKGACWRAVLVPPLLLLSLYCPPATADEHGWSTNTERMAADWKDKNTPSTDVSESEAMVSADAPTGGWDGGTHDWSKSIEGVQELRESQPKDSRFVSINNTIVTAQVSSTAVLHCRTSSATGGLVSWIRKRDYQLLTVGLKTHSMDDRFTINYVHWDWQLHIRYVQPRDAGMYECQVSSHPPTSIFLHLQVVEAEAEILGAPEKHVKAGSILRLVCILHYTTESPAYVFWYRDQQMINYNEEQSVVVESDEHTSVLLVTRADRQHSGNYTCFPSNAKPASILVHILNGELGEYPAAMQHGESTSISRPAHRLLLPSCLLLLLLLSPALLHAMPHWCCQCEGCYTSLNETDACHAAISKGRTTRNNQSEDDRKLKFATSKESFCVSQKKRDWCVPHSHSSVAASAPDRLVALPNVRQSRKKIALLELDSFHSAAKSSNAEHVDMAQYFSVGVSNNTTLPQKLAKFCTKEDIFYGEATCR